MPKKLGIVAALLLVGALTMIGGVGAAGATGAATRGSFAAPSAEHYLLTLLNADRKPYHLKALTLSPTLSTVARDHSRDMALHGYFGHQDPAGHGPFQRLAAAGVRFTTAGENLGQARAYGIQAAMAQLNTLMMSEPAGQINHRWIILNAKLQRVGIGIYILPGNRIYLTEDFIN